jgi:hypothetical protein
MQRIMGSIDSQIPITFLTTVGRCHEVSYDRRVRQRNSLSSISLSSIISYLSIIGAAHAQRCRHAHSLGISHSPCFAAVSILRFGRARRKPAASGRRMPQSLWEMLTILRMIASDRIDLSPFRTLFLHRVLNRAASPVCFSKGHAESGELGRAVDSPGFERTEGESSKISMEPLPLRRVEHQGASPCTGWDTADR